MDTVDVVGQAYQPRLIDAALQEALGTAGCVVLEGARGTGKTMTALNAAESYVFVDEPESQLMLSIAPRALLDGARPRLLDEWQVAPELWNLVRRQVDAAPAKAQFILTGSAVPADDVTRHTGAARFLRLRQRTLTWWEKLGRGPRPVSLSGLFNEDRPETDLDAGSDLDEIISLLLLPGFPAMLDLSASRAAAALRAYADEIARTDIRRLADVRNDPTVITHLLESIARNVATMTAYTTLADDVRVVSPDIRASTISTYVALLERLFVVETQAAWTPKLRSRARVRTSPKLHLVDAAFSAAVLGADANRLRRDLATLGHLFESAVTHDLTALVLPLGGSVRHYHDSGDREIDAVITLPDGRWGAVEIKLGGLQVQPAAVSLANAVAQVDAAASPPAFRLVVTGTGPTFALDDGTITCPLTALGP
ncbi:MAG TPA: DUF4143 domain-containing protein [Ilumatobacter sp.]|nr:DUF4143 domain-containing protein [Ilumatobacter sp.]